MVMTSLEVLTGEKFRETGILATNYSKRVDKTRFLLDVKHCYLKRISGEDCLHIYP
jgi:hypothetical protein